MPNTKHFLTRLRLLDEMLSDRHHFYTLDELTENVNDELRAMGCEEVTRRCIEKDIHFIEIDGPFRIPFERSSASVFSEEKQKDVVNRILRYTSDAIPIFNKEMSKDEKYLLSEAMSLLGQFDGLPELEGLERLRSSLGKSDSRQIISLSKNPLEGESTLGELYTAISNRQVVEITYHTFDDPATKLKIRLYPYLLKEYNRRWFLMAMDTAAGEMRNYGLDRIDKVKPLPAQKYVPYNGDINERYEDIIGVTYYEGNPVEHILFWVSDKSKCYVQTKPLHESQKKYSGSKEMALRAKYPQLEGGFFFSIDCMDNYELIRELTAFGADLIVLSPDNIRNEVMERVGQMHQTYQKLRT